MSYIFGAETELFAVPPSFATARSIPFPLAVRCLHGRIPTGGNMGRRQYLVGGHTANLMVDEHDRGLRQSIPQPAEAPTVVPVGGGTLQIAYWRFYDELTDERGPLSSGTSFTGGTTRTWSNIPTVVPGDSIIADGTVTFAAGAVTGSQTKFTNLRPGDRIAVSTALTRWARIRSISSDSNMVIDDTGMAGAGVAIVVKAVPRVSHVELWLSVNGALPRLALRVRLGTTTVTESVATLALGEAEVTPFTSMPYGSISVLYNKRQVIAGVAGREDTAFLSIIGSPERRSGLAFKTEYGEPIVGMLVYRKIIIVICPDSSYVLQGVADEDYVMTGLDPDVGGYGPAVIARGVAYVPGRKGIHAFNGAFHPVIPKRITEWTAFHVGGKTAMEMGFMAVNPNDGTVHFYVNYQQYISSSIPSDTPVWVGAYDDVGAQDSGRLVGPLWYSDSQELTSVNEAVTYAKYLVPSGARGGEFFYCSNTGKVYKEDDATALSDYAPVILTLRHECMGQFGGKEDEALELVRAWSYFLIESANGEFRVWMGDEYAAPLTFGPPGPLDTIATAAAYVHSMGAEEALNAWMANMANPKVTVVHPVIERDGRGFTIEYFFPNAKKLIFIGCGGQVKMTGIADRPPKWKPDSD